jgi:hypothetical protein
MSLHVKIVLLFVIVSISSCKGRLEKHGEAFAELIDLITKIKSALPKAKKATEQYYKKNPKSFAVVIPTDDIKDSLTDILEKLVGKEEKTEE